MYYLVINNLFQSTPQVWSREWPGAVGQLQKTKAAEKAAWPQELKCPGKIDGKFIINRGWPRSLREYKRENFSTEAIWIWRLIFADLRIQKRKVACRIIMTKPAAKPVSSCIRIFDWQPFFAQGFWRGLWEAREEKGEESPQPSPQGWKLNLSLLHWMGIFSDDNLTFSKNTSPEFPFSSFGDRFWTHRFGNFSTANFLTLDFKNVLFCLWLNYMLNSDTCMLKLSWI